MYPKRLILDDARNRGVAVLGLDINSSLDSYRVEAPAGGGGTGDGGTGEGGSGIRVPLTDVRGISTAEVDSIIAGQPYDSLSDAWQRSGMSRPTAERVIVAGGFDALYSLDIPTRMRHRGSMTRRDLLLQVADLDRYTSASGRGSTRGSARVGAAHAQLTLGLYDSLSDDPAARVASGLPEMTSAERVTAELDVLGMDVSHHVMEFYGDLLASLAAQGLPLVRSRDLLQQRSRSEVFVAGVKVATQTPPVRSGRRVIFLTLDDATGPADCTFFDDAQGPFAGTVFSSWLLLVRGEIRRTGPRGISLRATGCWELGAIRSAWLAGGIPAVADLVDQRPVETEEPARRRVLVHASGFRQSPYADIKPAGPDPSMAPPAKLWHSSPGSSGW
jgi:error-prone DNA polymerase